MSRRGPVVERIRVRKESHVQKRKTGRRHREPRPRDVRDFGKDANPLAQYQRQTRLGAHGSYGAHYTSLRREVFVADTPVNVHNVGTFRSWHAQKFDDKLTKDGRFY